MAFQIVPFWDDDDMVLSPSWSRPRYHRHQHHPLAQLFRDVDNLKRDAFNNGIVPRSDAFEVALDVHGFDPKELQVNLHDNYLTVAGRHEEKSPDGNSFISRSFTRKYHLPQNVNQDNLKSSLTNGGKTLRIEAPLLEANTPEAKAIPIEVTRGDQKAVNNK